MITLTRTPSGRTRPPRPDLRRSISRDLPLMTGIGALTVMVWHHRGRVAVDRSLLHGYLPSRSTTAFRVVRVVTEVGSPAVVIAMALGPSPPPLPARAATASRPDTPPASPRSSSSWPSCFRATAGSGGARGIGASGQRARGHLPCGRRRALPHGRDRRHGLGRADRRRHMDCIVLAREHLVPPGQPGRVNDETDQEGG